MGAMCVHGDARLESSKLAHRHRVRDQLTWTLLHFLGVCRPLPTAPLPRALVFREHAAGLLPLRLGT